MLEQLNKSINEDYNYSKAYDVMLIENILSISILCISSHVIVVI